MEKFYLAGKIYQYIGSSLRLSVNDFIFNYRKEFSAFSYCHDVKHHHPFHKMGLDKFPICIAKTPLSLSDNKKKLNVPTGWRLNINEINIAHGAGYVIPISGDVMLMPGLPRVPSAEHIDIDPDTNQISGLF